MHVSITEIRDNLADALDRVVKGGERVVVERRGKRVAALVSVEDLDVLEALEDAEDYRAALKARKEKGAIPLAKIKQRLGMK